jgi:signal transduction histidine kinase
MSQAPLTVSLFEVVESTLPGRLGPHPDEAPPGVVVAGLALGGLLLVAAVEWIALSGAARDPPALTAVAHGFVVAAPIAAGLYALATQPAPAKRFGIVLLVAGVLWAPTLLAESSESVAYSVGRVSAWLADAVLIYVVLAYPSGRLTNRVDRMLFGGALLVGGVLLLPTALLVDQYAIPSPWTSCRIDCPPNAFMAVSSQPGFVDGVIFPLARAATLGLYAGVAFVLARRLASGSRLTRLALSPVLGLAVVHVVAAAAFILMRNDAPDSQLTRALGLVAVLCMPALSLAFVAGMVRSRRAAARALARLAPGLGSRPDRAQLRDAIAEAVDDPSLEIAYWNAEDPGGWVDANGEPLALPSLTPERRLTEVRGSGGLVAVLIHDAVLDHAPIVSEVARGFALMALENQRLETQLRSSLRELRASRSRILSAADHERRRIERDLHDGAQQRLVGLGIQLGLAGELVEADPVKAARTLRQLARDVDDAVDEVRTLAAGLVPPLLVERGLVDALREAALASPLPATVSAPDVGRYRSEIESAVYFCCLEALQNAAKHASGARSVAVTLWEDDELHFEVRDDGPGMPDQPQHDGLGLTNMRDRIGAVGGRVTIESRRGEGACVAGVAPVAPADLAPQGETLLRRATDALEDRLAIYRALRDKRGVVVDFVVEHVNDAVCAGRQLVRANIVGRTLGELDPGFPASAEFRWLRRVLEGGLADSRTEVAYHGAVGAGRLTRVASDVRATPLEGGRVVVTWRDVTEQTHMREQLRLQALVLANQASGICVLRAADGAVIFANGPFAALFGYAPEELERRVLHEAIEADEPCELRRALRRIAAGVDREGEDRVVLTGTTSDGTAIRCATRVVAFDHPDQRKLLLALDAPAAAGLRRAPSRALSARWTRERPVS